MDDRILTLLRDARQQLEVERERRASPVAIVGIGCRFPGGASDPTAFWRLLQDRVDATSTVPADRWDAESFYDADPEVPGKAYTRRGAFLDRIDSFDPEFFGISPREAVGMDPQQRLLLEVVWEALEDAGIVPERLRGSATGVWIGLCVDDYASKSLLSGDFANIDAYSALGNTRSVAAGRISYLLDLRGPAIQLDTACSSSLVAIHQACQSLRLRECDLAIVGGVNLMSAPESTIALCKMRALAPDGRCKTFDASADGYGRGEGCGIVILKRFGDARAAGDRIYASLRGSAVNHDGHSNGLTAPSGLAQEAVISTALANAGVEPADVDYVEAHGTGTLLGDPIEVLALSRAYGRGRSSDSPLHLGAVKTNLGHLEGAAGVAGVIKVALCLTHARLPPNLHLRTPNPRIAWSNLPLRVVTEEVAWSARGKLRLAGVSSFGISGTNAHVVMEEAPCLEAPPPARTRSAELIVLSAKTPDALDIMAQRLRRHLEMHPELTLAEVAYNLLATRSHLDHRVALAIPTLGELRDTLQSTVKAGTFTTVTAPAGTTSPRVVFVFPGQGSQWLGMGRELLLEEPAFADAMAECDRAVRNETHWSVLDEIRGTNASRLERVDIVQPVLFSIQVALAALWRSWGIEPHAVVGHSMGEVAAAVVAGALSLEDGVAVVARRSRLLRKISDKGVMVLVDLSIDEAQKAISGFERWLGVAVNNSSRSTVLSGEPAAMAEVVARLEVQGVFCRRIKVDVASHGPQVDPLLPELFAVLSDLQPASSQIPMHSTVTGAVLRGSELTARYWVDNVRRPVQFARTVESLSAAGFTHFLEISPHPLLVTSMQQIHQELGAEGFVTGSLRRGQPERLTLLESLGALHCRGCRLDAELLFPAGLRRMGLPTYPWQRQRYWHDAPTSRVVSRANLELEDAIERLGALAHLSKAARDALPEVLLALNRERAASVVAPVVPEPVPEPVYRDDPSSAASLTYVLRAEVARVLSFASPMRIPLDRNLQELGLDSLMKVELRSSLNRKCGIMLSAGFSFDRTLNGLVKELLPLLPASSRGAPVHGAERRSVIPAVSQLEQPSALCERLHQVSQCRARLFCFHAAGASASMFLPFRRLEREQIEVHTISSIRRQSGWSTDLAFGYLTSVLDYIKSLGDRPYVLFGHSLGSLFAWRVAQETAFAAARPPLLLSASAAPPLPAGSLATPERMESLSSMLNDRSIFRGDLASFREDLRSDIALWEAMPLPTRQMLEIPIAAFAGRDDPLASEQDMKAWHQCTTAEFSLSLLPGGHQYIYSSEPCGTLLDELSAMILRQLSAESQNGVELHR